MQEIALSFRMQISQVWTEKYRPKSIEDMILGESEKEFFSSLIDIPNNLLLVGNPGIGKSTMAKILARKFSPHSYLYINASEQGNVDTVRNLISDFISVGSIDGNPKVVILDECLDQDTLVTVLSDGEMVQKKIMNVDPNNDLVKSFNFKTDRIEYRPFIKLDRGEQEVFEIEFSNDEIIVCTGDHKWYVDVDGIPTKMKLSEMISKGITEIITI